MDPSASINYIHPTTKADLSALFTGGDNVRIVATFDPALVATPLPTIALNPSGTLVNLPATSMTISGSDTTTWYYDYIVPNTGDGYQNITLGTGESASGNVITTLNGGILGTRSFAIDNTLPSILSAAIGSDNSYGSGFAIDGDTITLNFIASEPLRVDVDPSINFSVGGTPIVGSVTTTQTGTTNWKVAFDVSSGDIDGDVSFNIVYVDSGDNTKNFASSDSANADVISGTVRYDNTAPSAVLSRINPTDRASWTGPYKSGDVVRMGVLFSELMNSSQIPQITIASSVSDPGSVYVGPVNLTNDYVNSTGSKDAFYYDYTIPAGVNDTLMVSVGTGLDLAGNSITTDGSGFTNTKTFIVDNSAAIFRALEIRSSSDYDSTLAKVGDTVFLDLSFNEDLSALSASIGSVDASIGQTIADGRLVYTASRVLLESDTEGSLVFSVTATDKANNVVVRGSDANLVVNGVTIATDQSSTNYSNVRFDKTAPFVSDLSFYSSNSIETLATTGDTITAEFITTEKILDPSGLVFAVGNTSLVTTPTIIEETDGSRHWKISTTIAAGDATQGDISFNVLLTDLAGNEQNVHLGDVSSSYSGATTIPGAPVTGSVRLDNVSPEFQLAKMYSSNADVSGFAEGSQGYATSSETIYLNLSFNEPVYIPSAGFDVSFSVGGQNMNNSTITTIYGDTSNQLISSFELRNDQKEGQMDFTITATDLAGNTTTTTSLTGSNKKVLFDRTAPVISNINFVKQSAGATDGVSQVRTENIVRLTFNSSELLRDLSGTNRLTFKSGGQPVTNAPTIENTGTFYNARYTTHENDTEGFITYDISAFDTTGNFAFFTTTNATAQQSNDLSLAFDKQPRATVTYDVCGGGDARPYTEYKSGDVFRIIATFDQSLNTSINVQPPRINITHTPDDVASLLNVRLNQLKSDNKKIWYYDYDVSAGNYDAAITFPAGSADSDNDKVRIDPLSGGSFAVINEPKITFSYSPYFEPFVTGSTTITAAFEKDVCNSGTGVFVTTGVHDISQVMTRIDSKTYKYTYTIPQSRSGQQTIKLFGLQDRVGNDVSGGRYFNNTFNIHNNRNFYISEFNKDIAMTISGAIETGPDAPDQVDVSATAYVYLDKTRLSHVFHFTSDAIDISDNEPGTDIRFDISTGGFAGLFNNAENSVLGDAQVAFDTNTLADVPKVATTYKTSADGVQFSTGTRGIKYDVIRDLAQQLFNTYHATDLFQNEGALRNNVHDIINDLVSSDTTKGITKVVYDCSRNEYDGTNRANIGSEILRQMIKQTSNGLTLTRDPAGSTTGLYSTDVSNLYYMPFEDGDVIQFILNVAGAPNQKALIGLTGTTHRRYDIRLIADPNPTSSNFDASNNDL